MTTIPENTTVGDSIGVTVHAVPGGSDTLTHVITYSIVGGNPHGAFAIDADTGLMTVASSLGIDYEGIDSHMISVIVSTTEYLYITVLTLCINKRLKLWILWTPLALRILQQQL